MSDAEQNTRPNPRKAREGLVVSTKMDKTVVVAVIDRKQHAPQRRFVAARDETYPIPAFGSACRPEVLGNTPQITQHKINHASRLPRPGVSEPSMR